MPSSILTDGATFTCPHGGAGTAASGLTISALAQNVTIGGHKPILAGAMITGFTPKLGCTRMVTPPPPSGPTPLPCIGFSLPPPSGQAMTINGLAVYTAADASNFASAPSTGNGDPGLQVSEPQSLVTA